jgi:hypothetical protein
MNVYRYIFGTTLVDVIVTPTGGGGFQATAYVVFQGSLARRPVLHGSDVLSVDGQREHVARDAMVTMLQSRLGPIKRTPWAGQKIDEPDFLRIVR